VGAASHSCSAVSSAEPEEGYVAMAKTVLIADDAAFMRMLLRDILSGDGYSVYEAVNGRDACEKFAEVRPDVVTMDLTMPEMDGLAAVRAIIKQDPNARVIIVSAQARPEIRAEAISAGAIDFVCKPFGPERLLESIRSCLTATAC
jgi:two-component system chemotaxis response regulator CheY